MRAKRLGVKKIIISNKDTSLKFKISIYLLLYVAYNVAHLFSLKKVILFCKIGYFNFLPFYIITPLLVLVLYFIIYYELHIFIFQG